MSRHDWNMWAIRLIMGVVFALSLFIVVKDAASTELGSERLAIIILAVAFASFSMRVIWFSFRGK